MTATPPPTTAPASTGGSSDQDQLFQQVQGQIQQQAQQQQLPATGVQQQVASVNAQQVPEAAPAPQQAMQPQPGGTGVTSLGGMAQSLAKNYGLPIGRGGLVDEQGNFLMTPQQVADQSGGQVSSGEAAASMNYISQAIYEERRRRDQQKGIAALQTGLGQVQSRGRGSLAAMQSGFYQQLAQTYMEGDYQAADFSYFIQKEQLDIEFAISENMRKAAEKKAKGSAIGGGIGSLIGAFSGIPGLGQAGSALGEGISSWF